MRLDAAADQATPGIESVHKAYRRANNPFSEFRVITYDFEYISKDGERPDPVCMVWHDWETDEFHRVWCDELQRLKEPPFPVDESTLLLTYYGGAELSCHQVLGWQHPENLIDCHVEFRNRTNGLKVPCGNSLLGAMIYYGIPTMAGGMKEAMRELILGGGPWSEEQQQAILEYCEADVRSLSLLAKEMAPDIDIDIALYRGFYVSALSRVADRGIPLDTETLGAIRQAWPVLLQDLIREVDLEYGCYEGSSFRQDRFAEYLIREGIEWPRTPTGRLDLSDSTFRSKALQHPKLEQLRELRSTLSQTRNLQLSVGSDGRNRVMLSPFASRTGRNQPSTTKFVFGPAKWVRFLIKPEEGRALAYCDYSQQEFGIAAALSGDQAMQEAYRSGDPYLAFAMKSGMVPLDASPETHASERDQFKTCALGVLYGLTAEGLARKLDAPSETGRQLLRHHHNCYPDFWRWSQDNVSQALLRQEIQTVMGWKMKVPPRRDADNGPNPRSLANFPMQANASEILRIAIIEAVSQGIQVCAPVHDALLIEADLEDIEDAVAITVECMSEAAQYVLDGFRLNCDVDVIRWPDRYYDKRGAAMWETVMKLLPKNCT